MDMSVQTDKLSSVFFFSLIICVVPLPLFLSKRHCILKAFILLTPTVMIVTAFYYPWISLVHWVLFNFLILGYVWLGYFLFLLLRTSPFFPLSITLFLFPFVIQIMRSLLPQLNDISNDAIFAGYTLTCLPLSLLFLILGFLNRSQQTKQKLLSICDAIRQKAEGWI